MTEYKFICNEIYYNLPDGLFNKSSVLINLLEDTAEEDTTILPLPDKYSESIEYLVTIYNELQKIEFLKMSLIDYFEANIDNYISDYCSKNFQCLFLNKIVKLNEEYSIQALYNVIDLCDFLDIQSVIYCMCLMVSYKIKDYNYNEKRYIIKKLRCNLEQLNYYDTISNLEKKEDVEYYFKIFDILDKKTLTLINQTCSYTVNSYNILKELINNFSNNFNDDHTKVCELQIRIKNITYYNKKYPFVEPEYDLDEAAFDSSYEYDYEEERSEQIAIYNKQKYSNCDDWIGYEIANIPEHVKSNKYGIYIHKNALDKMYLTIRIKYNLCFLDTSLVTDMGDLFKNFTSFNGDLIWNTGNVKNMNKMFYNAERFNKSINYWNTSNVIYMNHMFFNAKNFNQELDMLDVSNVENMEYMFSSAKSFNKSIESWNISKVNSIKCMFNKAESYNKSMNLLDLSNINCISGLFCNAINYNQETIFNIPNVTEVINMFCGCKSLNNKITLTIDKCDNLDSLFSGCSDLDSVITINNSNNVESTQYMFSGAVKFNKPILFDTSNVVYMKNMFWGCSNFNQPLYFDTKKVDDMSSMFNSATNFNSYLNFDTSNVHNMKGMFKNASNFNQDLNYLITKNVRYMSSMFESASKFNQPLDNWNTNKVIFMNNMFKNAESFNQSLNTWDTSRVSSMIHMFLGAKKYEYENSNKFSKTNIVLDAGSFVRVD
jgi:hypothetical protein